MAWRCLEAGKHILTSDYVNEAWDGHGIYEGSTLLLSVSRDAEDDYLCCIRPVMVSVKLDPLDGQLDVTRSNRKTRIFIHGITDGCRCVQRRNDSNLEQCTHGNMQESKPSDDDQVLQIRGPCLLVISQVELRPV